MLILSQSNLDKLLDYIAEALDISPTDYDAAVRSYNSVGKWLVDGASKGCYSESRKVPFVYPQGSINLGTIIRPVRAGKEADFDIDLVCELQVRKDRVTPERVKWQVGERLKKNVRYNDKLEPEGKRCWTLTFDEAENAGFHIDILPCLPYLADDHPVYKGAISITHKDKGTSEYRWKPGNPRGYGRWFKDRNVGFDTFARGQRQSIFESYRLDSKGRVKYEKVDDVPEQLVRTPLQRAIQLMKRHRDLRFVDDPGGYKPISIIITTLAAHLYRGEREIYTTLKNIVDQLEKHKELIENKFFVVREKGGYSNLISRDAAGKWKIPNPVNSGENFADRWQEENNARAIAFFKWVTWLRDDVALLEKADTKDSLKGDLIRIFGERVSDNAMKRLKLVDSPKESMILRMKQTWSLGFNVAWKKQPQWQVRGERNFSITARLSQHDGFRTFTYCYTSGAEYLSKGLTVRFEAQIDAPECKYYWQVTNTGDEAAEANDLRGGFVLDSRIHDEKTKYSGEHCVQCFLVKEGVCIAHSQEFIVKIR